MLLRVKGLDYDEWLDEKHRAVIEENQELMMRGLQVILDNNNTSSNSSNHNSVNDNSSSVSSLASESNTNTID